MTLEDVVKKLNKSVLLNKKIPEEMRMLQTEKLNPDTKKIFSEERKLLVKRLVGGKYNTNDDLKVDLKKINFDLSWVTLLDANLSNLDFSNVNFSVADLSGSNFSGCNLSGADFSLAKITSADFARADMHAANLSLVDCSDAIFNNTNISMSTFVSCIAVSTDFMGADASNADFSNSNLKNAKFEGANTSGINIDNCIVEGTIFEGHGEGSVAGAKKYTENIGDIYKETDKIRGMLQDSVYTSGSLYTSEIRYKRKSKYG